MARPKEFDPTQVLDKAVELWWYKGYEGTSVQDLTHHLGIGRGSLYDTYGDKHSLYLAALDRYSELQKAQFAILLEQSASIREFLAQAFEQLIAAARTDPQCRGCFITNATTEMAGLDPDVAQRVAANRDQLIAVFATALAQAQQHGEIAARHQPEALAAFFFSVFQGLQVLLKTRPPQQMLDDIVAVALATLDPDVR